MKIIRDKIKKYFFNVNYNLFEQRILANHSKLIIILVYSIIDILVAIAFYPVIPIVLNYPPESINNRFNIEILSISYKWQYVIMIFIIITLGSIVLNILLKQINKWSIINSQADTDEKINCIKNIRKKCFNLPYIIYVFQVGILVIIPIMILLILNIEGGIIPVSRLIVIFKIGILIFSFTILASIISLLFSKKLFTKILIKTFSSEYQNDGIRINLKNKLLLQIFPTILVALLFTSLFGYSALVKEKGNLLFQVVQGELKKSFSGINEINDITQIKKILDTIHITDVNYTSFIISPKNYIYTSDGGTLSNFFIKYLKDISPKYDGRVYDTYASDTQGVFIQVKGPDGFWKIGIKYEILSLGAITFLIIGFFILLFINFYVLYYFSKSFADDISLVTKGLNEIVKGENVDFDKKLPITSNDEIGDLVLAFNKIQEVQKSYRAREKLLSLGELAGGLAHDIANPITATSGLLSCIGIIIRKYEKQIKNGSCNNDEFLKTAGDIKELIQEANNELSYASTIVEDVRDHIKLGRYQLSADFYVNDIVKCIDGRNLKDDCIVNVISNIDPNILINGPFAVLERSIRNILKNASDAYTHEEEKIVDVTINLINNEKTIKIEFRDYTKNGLSEDAEKRLFSEMVTSKGKNGTGLGMFLTRTAIASRFNGDVTFKRQDKGTSFYILVPYKNDNI